MIKMINEKQLLKYSRQLIIPGLEEEGQELLLSKNILIVGAGGLGCPTALYCTAAGFGNIEIWDNDNVALSDLNRQIGHKEKNIGCNKAKSLSQSCIDLNPDVNINYNENYFNKNSIIEKFDIIFDCTDNIESRYLINKLAHKESKILISGSATQLEGQLMVIKSGIEPTMPCYECIFPNLAEEMPNFNCRESGILGSITSFISSLQVTEAIREVMLDLKKSNNNIKSRFDTSNAGLLILYDGFLQELNKIRIKKDLNCLICSKS